MRVITSLESLKQQIDRLIHNVDICHICILMRHAEKEELTSFFGNEAKLTEQGKQSAKNIGKAISKNISYVATSPLIRCVETAKNIFFNQKDMIINTSSLLGHPGIIIENPETAGKAFEKKKSEDIANHLISSQENPEGFCRSTKNALQSFMRYLLKMSDNQPQASLFITHDIILAVIIAYYYCEKDTRKIWPNYLDYLLLWILDNTIYFSYKGNEINFFLDEIMNAEFLMNS